MHMEVLSHGQATYVGGTELRPVPALAYSCA
jgi:hypothetical protein